MAQKNTISKSNKKNKSVQSNPTEERLTNQRKWQLGIGFFLLLAGSYLTVSIISYFVSWQQDQDALISSQSLSDFLFRDQSMVNNWCGRLGAVAAHLLVYRGLGVMAILLTIWIAGWGINLINGKKILPVIRWVRWLALGFLFFCPLLAFGFPKVEFPLGGALGNGLVGWMNGFAGMAGNLLMLLGVLCFFIFIVFQWDIKPFLNKTKDLVASSRAKTTFLNEGENETFKGYRHPTAQEEDAMNKGLFPPPPPIEEDSNNTDHSGMSVAKGLGKEKRSQDHPELEMTIIDKTGEQDSNSTDSPIHYEQPEPVEVNTAGPLTPIPQIPGEPDFEVHTTEEKSGVPKNGDHISIESGEPYDPSLDLPSYKFPTLDLLEDRGSGTAALDHDELQQNKEQIVSTLRSFGIEIQKISATVGPTVTLYEIVPAEGVRISKIRNLEDDIALSLAALGIRIIAPIPGRGTIGIEVPNKKKQIVSIRAMLSSEKFINSKMSLPIALGKKIDNDNYIVDLAKMPHLLMAGATGQGKSVGINTILVSLLYKKHPSQLKFVLVDPKKVELSIYRLIEKHYLAILPGEEEPIITDVRKVINTLNALCIEMDNRYELLKDAGTRNIKEYNDKFIKRRLNPEDGHKYLPFIVLVIDEFADLIMTAGKEVEQPIARLAQLARAVGIHLIIATQRPSVNVITGIIKANFPARAAFRVSAKVDSRTILDTGGAEQLIGQGDMLISNGSELLRLQCAFVDTPEVERIVDFIGQQRGYPTPFLLPEYIDESAEAEKHDVDLSQRDKLFEDCARLVVNSQSGSTSMLQRKFNIGYNRAGRIMDQLEAAGIVGGASGSKPRDVLIGSEYELDNLINDLG